MNYTIYIAYRSLEITTAHHTIDSKIDGYLNIKTSEKIGSGKGGSNMHSTTSNKNSDNTHTK